VAERTTEELNEIQRAEQLQRYRDLRTAFVELFGPPGKRTPQGAIVLEHLEKFCGTRRLISELTTEGATDIYRTARKHGRCDVMQAIHDLLEWKEPNDGDSSRGS
jgi:hypothetical protein